MSKLPKLSDTKRQVEKTLNSDDEPVETIPAPVVPLPRRSAIGGEIWFNLIVGILLLSMGRDFGHYLISRMMHQPFHTNVFWPDDSPKAGQEVEYFDLTGFTAVSDMGIFLFGITVILEAFSKLIVSNANVSKWRFYPLMLSWTLTSPVVLLNSYVCFKLYNFGVTPILSGLAVAFGGWMLIDEWRSIIQYSKKYRALAQ